MHKMSAWHVRGEVLTGAAVESAGRPPAVIGREGSIMDLGRVPDDLDQRWQKAYAEYITADRTEGPTADPVRMARLSVAVASAWRDLAAYPGLPWVLVASLTTSAEAFERQAEGDRWRMSAGRPTERESGSGRGGPGGPWSGSLGSGFGGV